MKAPFRVEEKKLILRFGIRLEYFWWKTPKDNLATCALISAATGKPYATTLDYRDYSAFERSLKGHCLPECLASHLIPSPAKGLTIHTLTRGKCPNRPMATCSLFVRKRNQWSHLVTLVTSGNIGHICHTLSVAMFCYGCR